MKVQTKITLLLVLVVATFFAGVATIRIYDQLKFRRIADERFSERNRSFEDFLNYNGEPLQTLAEFDTCWDQMVDAVATNNYQWFGENVNNSTLDSYHANAIWIYRPNGTLAYPLNNLNTAELTEIPIPKEAFAKIFERQPLAHFFLKVPQGIMEIRAATIHPSKDFHRESAEKGYFFAGCLWSNGKIHEMSLFTNNEISLVPPGKLSAGFINDEQNGSIVFSRVLSSWDGQPLARLIIRNESRVVRELNRSSERLLLALIVFALILLVLLSVSLVRWVRRPLRQIMESLERDDPKPVEKLRRDGSEFGELARTVHKFFAQRADLIREMDERRATEEALRKSEEELRHSQKLEAVGRLAGGVAHDFNNLLTAIIGYAELLIGRANNETMVRQNAALIRKAGEQAATLTRQLLAFSRKQLLQPKVIDLNHLVVDMEKLLRRVIGERFDLRTISDAKNGRVKADPSQIEQVILNLGVNARDAMPTGGRLTIRTSNIHLDETTAPQISASLRSGDYVVLAVTDTGDGMDEETKSRIFEPFFTTKGPGKGTGLGLATVYGIVRQSGGGISVESEIGKGSTFSIYLPQELAATDPIKHQSVPVEKSRDFETVLVVEDEDIVRALVCDVLSEQGYNVIWAANGAEALQLAKDTPAIIDLLVTDVIMPQMNGQELAVQLTALRPSMKVLFVSGYSDNDIGDHGVLDPNIDLLEKPFTPQALARKVRDILGDDHDARVAPIAADAGKPA
jgi:two-component system cell cycle sensor histidine kinase/response regulator CckA